MTRLLIAASTGITNEAWIKRCLLASMPETDLSITQFGSNTALSSTLLSLNYSREIVASGAQAEKRSEIRRALQNASHLLLLWDGQSLTKLLFEARLRSLPTKLYTTETTMVLNKDRGDDFDIYIGRGTPWGNPYPVGKQEGQYSREEAIEYFKRHFYENIVPNPSLRKGLLGLRGYRLGCHCKPLACHGDVISSYLNSLDPDEVIAELGDQTHLQSSTPES